MHHTKLQIIYLIKEQKKWIPIDDLRNWDGVPDRNHFLSPGSDLVHQGGGKDQITRK